ncbi:MAG: hypothetical protein KDA80_01075, partial [Planctomycetaceae bacterium]|nr:hypothetical protein [Planctomycetaceae bacterium]
MQAIRPVGDGRNPEDLTPAGNLTPGTLGGGRFDVDSSVTAQKWAWLIPVRDQRRFPVGIPILSVPAKPASLMSTPSDLPSPRIAITGLGLVTPLAGDAERTWKRLLAGQTAGCWISPEDLGTTHPKLLKNICWFGAPVQGFHSARSRLIAFAEQATREAIEGAKLTTRELEHAVCVIGTSKPDLTAIDHSGYPFQDVYPSSAAHHVAALWNCQRGALAPVAACATGLLSVHRAAELIREGVSPIAIAGSTDASLHPGLLASYQRLGVLAAPGDSPGSCCRPFDQNRDGFLVGEGAGILVLEDWAHARARGANVLAEWIVGRCVSDPTGLTLIDSTGTPVVRCLEQLFQGTRVPARESIAINVHGTATELNDLAEGNAIRRFFKGNPPNCFGIKGAIGHLMGAAGAVELVCCVLALRDQQIPVSANHVRADPQTGISLTTHSMQFPVE